MEEFFKKVVKWISEKPTRAIVVGLVAVTIIVGGLLNVGCSSFHVDKASVESALLQENPPS